MGVGLPEGLIIVLLPVLESRDVVHVMCDRPPPGGEPLLRVPKGPRAISLGACTATNFFKQAVPADVSTRGLSLGA